MKRKLFTCLLSVFVMFTNMNYLVFAEEEKPFQETAAEETDETASEESAEEQEVSDTFEADDPETQSEETEIHEVSETIPQEEAVPEEEISEEKTENYENEYQAAQNGLSEAGSPYAVITDKKELIFFRSYNTYKDEARATVTDILGNKYTGFVYDCIKDGYMPWDSPSFLDLKPASIFTAEGQVIRFPAEISFDFVFRGCSYLKRVDFSRLLMENVTSMFYMFRDCDQLTDVDLSGLNTSKVTDMGSMFDGCSSLQHIDISSFNTRSVTNMWFMFDDCSSLKSIKLGPQFTKWTNSAYLPEGIWTHGNLNKTEKELFNQYPSNAQQWAGEWKFIPAPSSITIRQGKSGELATDASMNLTIKTTPDNAFGGVKWSSGNAKVASVNQSGKVTANTYGKTTITAASTYNKKVTAKFVVQTRFFDVNDSSRSYYKPVYWGADNGVVAGFNGGEYFGPDEICTRAQFVTFLWRLAGKPTGTKTVDFYDIRGDENYYRAIQWAVSKGIIVGFKNDNVFRPNEEVTRRQVAVMLWRYAGKKTPALPGTSPFTDISSSDNAYKAVVWGKSAGVIAGYKDGTFRPDASCLRQQVVTFLYRYARDVMKLNVN